MVEENAGPNPGIRTAAGAEFDLARAGTVVSASRAEAQYSQSISAAISKPFIARSSSNAYFPWLTIFFFSRAGQ
jgi:hypothetical protein